MNRKSIISEIALRCGDIDFRDFPQNVYEKIFMQQAKEIARKYKIDKRLYTDVFYNSNGETKLPIKNFVKEFKVLINGNEYTSDSAVNLSEDNTYSLMLLEGELIFRYRPYSNKDEIQIYYIGSIDVDDEEENYIPLLPSQFREETVSYSVVEMAKLGLAKYAYDEGKAARFKAILTTYAKQPGVKSDLITETEFIAIKPYRVLP